MANIKSAKKRIRVIESKTQRNKRVKAHLKGILKSFEAAVAAEEKQEARDQLALAEKKLMQAAAKGTVHKNSASRKIARITQRFVQVFGKDALLEKANKPSIPDPEEKKARKEAKEAAMAEATAKKAASRSRTKKVTKSTKVESAEEAETAETPVEEVLAEETPEEDAPTEKAPAEE